MCIASSKLQNYTMVAKYDINTNNTTQKDNPVFRRLFELKRKGLFRRFRTISSSCGGTVQFKNKRYIMLASNNYFGLNTHPDVIRAAKNALTKYGSGNVASRLVVNLDIHEELENAIASYKKTQSALVYSSGYVTNIGIISSIVGHGDIILSDQLNHASIIDGCRLSNADINVYKHCNVDHLKSILKKYSKRYAQNSKSRILVVTDTVFSMDGDLAPLKEIIELKKRYKFILMVDDAHSLGIVDTNYNEIDVNMGTLSKTLGSQGGYVAGTKELIDYLRNTSRSFMYSTGISPSNAASALAALSIVRKDKSLRYSLLKNASYLRDGLIKLGYDAKGEFQIIPIIIGDNNKTMRAQRFLEQERIFVTGIRPPTVPTARLRASVMATHTKQQLENALIAFEKLGVKLNLKLEDVPKNE